MDAKYNLTGKDCKDLVEAIQNIAGMKAVYKKASIFEYVVNNFIIDKEETVTCKDEAALESLVESLIPAAYTSEGYEGTSPFRSRFHSIRWTLVILQNFWMPKGTL